MLSRLFRISLLGSVSVWIVSACGSSKSQGAEGGACYGNGTCDAGLICSKGETCVNPSAGAGGSGNGAGGGANLPSVDLAACFACGDEACPAEKQACDDAPGCSEVLGCTVECGDDILCKSKCTPSTNLTPEQVAAYGLAIGDYTRCSTLSCLSECSVQVDLGSGGGSPGAGGGSSDSGGASNSGGAGNGAGGKASGGAGNGTGGKASGGSSSGGAPAVTGVLIFDGVGVGVGSEELGIDGGFYILEDSVKDGELIEDPFGHTDLDAIDSTLEPSTFEISEYACVEGTVAQVLDADGAICEVNSEDCDWAAYWGGGIGLSMKVVEDVATAWDAEAAGATAFRFQLSGDVSGAAVRFMVEDTEGNQFCKDGISVGSAVTVQLSSLKHNCWDPGSMTLDRTKIKSVSWQFVPDASQEYPIDTFCIENVYVLD